MRLRRPTPVMFAVTTIGIIVAFRLTMSDDQFAVGRRYQVTVAKVFDGDTFETTTGQRVRLLGVDSPEVEHGDKPGQPYGDEAGDWMRKICGGQEVTLHEGAEPIDRYGRTLAWVYLSDGRLLNAELLSTGHAKLMARFGLPFDLEPQLRKAQATARLSRIGLWSRK